MVWLDPTWTLPKVTVSPAPSGWVFQSTDSPATPVPRRKSVIVLPASVQFALLKVQIVIVALGDPSWNGSNCTVKSRVPVGLIVIGNCLTHAPPHKVGDSGHTTEKYGVYGGVRELIPARARLERDAGFGPVFVKRNSTSATLPSATDRKS